MAGLDTADPARPEPAADHTRASTSGHNPPAMGRVAATVSCRTSPCSCGPRPQQGQRPAPCEAGTGAPPALCSELPGGVTDGRDGAGQSCSRGVSNAPSWPCGHWAGRGVPSLWPVLRGAGASPRAPRCHPHTQWPLARPVSSLRPLWTLSRAPHCPLSHERQGHSRGSMVHLTPPSGPFLYPFLLQS